MQFYAFVECVILHILFFFFKQKTAYEMRISDWSSDVCSSDLVFAGLRWPLVCRPMRRRACLSDWLYWRRSKRGWQPRLRARQRAEMRCDAPTPEPPPVSLTGIRTNRWSTELGRASWRERGVHSG